MSNEQQTNPVLSELVRNSFDKAQEQTPNFNQSNAAGASDLAMRDKLQQALQGDQTAPAAAAIPGKESAPPGTANDVPAEPHPLEAPADTEATEPRPDDQVPEGQFSLHELSELLGTDDETLYKRLRIPQSGDRPAMTLGELKDLNAQAETLKQRERAVQDKAMQLETAYLQRTQELNALLDLQPDIGPELREQIQRHSQSRMAQNATAARDLITEWSDPEIEKQDVADIVKTVLEPLGMNEAHVISAAVADHRWLKVLRDFMMVRKQLAAADAEIKGLKSIPKNVTPTKNVRGRARTNGAQNPNVKPSLHDAFESLMRR